MAFALVFLGGGLGSLCRYSVSLLSAMFSGGAFPVATFIVNITGCFLIGGLGCLGERGLLDANLRLLLQTGFLGGFTTFSAFGLESFQMFRGNAPAMGVGYVLLSNGLGLASLFLGYLLARGLLKN